jgi:hypothetical protein
MEGDLTALLAQIFIYAIFLIGFIEFIRWAKSRGKRKRKPVEAVELKPKIEETQQTKPYTLKLPTVVPKKVKVVVLYPERQIETFGKISDDGCQVKTKKLGVFVIPKDYKPKITWSGRKTYLTFYFSSEGNALEIKNDGKVEPLAPDPMFNQLLVDKGLVARIFRLGIDFTSLITGIGLGVFVFSCLLFVFMPMIGIPVQIGRNPVEVITQTQTGIPPSGNWTIPP